MRSKWKNVALALLLALAFCLTLTACETEDEIEQIVTTDWSNVKGSSGNDIWWSEYKKYDEQDSEAAWHWVVRRVYDFDEKRSEYLSDDEGGVFLSEVEVVAHINDTEDISRVSMYYQLDKDVLSALNALDKSADTDDERYLLVEFTYGNYGQVPTYVTFTYERSSTVYTASYQMHYAAEGYSSLEYVSSDSTDVSSSYANTVLSPALRLILDRTANDVTFTQNVFKLAEQARTTANTVLLDTRTARRQSA